MLGYKELQKFMYMLDELESVLNGWEYQDLQELYLVLLKEEKVRKDLLVQMVMEVYDKKTAELRNQERR